MKVKKKPTVTASRQRRKKSPKKQIYDLRLYVAGQSPKSLTAFANLKQLCDVHLAGKYRIEVIDLMTKPQLARDDGIIAIPTLVRRLPEPIRKIIGDLCDTQGTLRGLDLFQSKGNGFDD
jgi:circadian clock protein KaiB